MKKEFKLGDKVMCNWEECTYVGEYSSGYHLIDWYSNGHDWKIDDTIKRAKESWYTFSWNDYYLTITKELSPVTKNIANL